MKIHYSFDTAINIKNPIVTTGSFDGVHVGHQVILNRLKYLAKNNNGESVLITFHPHPRKVLFPEKSKDLKLINSQAEKKILLESVGLDHLIIIEFTKEFTETTSDVFINEYLLGIIKAHTIIVGFNHHFGHNRTGDFNYLHNLSKERNFNVEEIPMQDIENEAVSSTRIRVAIKNGHIGRANAYLNHQYFITAKTKKVKSPIYNNQEVVEIIIDEDIKMLPPDGRYAAKSIFQNNRQNVICDIINSRIYAICENVNIFDNYNIVNFELYKNIRFFDDSELFSTLKKDIEEVNDLIY